MPTEQRPSARTSPTPKASLETPKGYLTVRRVSIPGTGTTVEVIPARFNSFICKNSGLTLIRFNFQSRAGQDLAADYWELAPGESLPVAIPVTDRVRMRIRSQGGAGEIQCILWG